MHRQRWLAARRLFAACVLAICSLFAGYNAYRLYSVKPVIWVNGVGLPLTAVTPRLERAFALIRSDLPELSSSMREQLAARRWQVGMLAVLSFGLLCAAVIAIRR